MQVEFDAVDQAYFDADMEYLFDLLDGKVREGKISVSEAEAFIPKDVKDRAVERFKECEGGTCDCPTH